MKLHCDTHGFEGSLPENRIKMTIKQSAKMFQILSDGIYKDKILAVIREYVCNAYDSHVTVGKKDVPFTVHLPNYLDPTFSVTDYGSGVDPSLIGEIFWTYGESSKTNDENTIGALGLGSKSAFAYTKSSFIVKNRFHGIEYTYICFINESGEPEGSCVGEEATQETNGITVEFAVRPGDLEAFYERFARIYKYWANVKPTIKGVELADFSANYLSEPKKVLEGNGWYLENGSEHEHAIAIMGNVAYPIESASIPNLPIGLKAIADNTFVITVPLGELEFASSREALSYTEFTCQKLIDQLERVRSEMAQSFHDKVFSASNDHLTFMKTFHRTFDEFCRIVNVSKIYNGRGQYDVNYETYSKMLLPGSGKTLTFKGADYSVLDLIKGRFQAEREAYLPYGLYEPAYGRGDNLKFKPITDINAENTITVNSADFYERSARDMAPGTLKNHFDWKAKFVSKRVTEFSFIDKIIMNADKFKFTTSESFQITANARGLSIVVNDVGTSGRDRFKYAKSGLQGQILYAEFNPKVNTLVEVLDSLNELINTRLSGTGVILLSSLPDARPPVEKTKIDKGSIKLKVMSLNLKPTVHRFRSVGVADGFLPNNAINLKAKQIEMQLENKILQIADLSAKAQVPFIVKRRVQKIYYDDVNGIKEAITHDPDVLATVVHLGLIEDDQVLLITEGQYDFLLQKGVKLVTLSKIISKKIEALNDTENFVNVMKRLMTLSKVGTIWNPWNIFNRYDAAKEIDGWKDSESMFKSLVNEYSELRKTSQNEVTFAKLYLYSKFVKSVHVSDEVNEIVDQLDLMYPMLGLTTICSLDQLNRVVNYVEMIDSLLESSIKQTIDELEQRHEEVPA